VRPKTIAQTAITTDAFMAFSPATFIVKLSRDQ
jgi:hypothetical protein